MTEPKTTDLPMQVEQTGHRIIGCAIEVHRQLGPGFKEPIYAEALCLELHSRGEVFEREKPILVNYKNWQIKGQRLDLVVGGHVIVELKSVRRLKDLHRRQVVSYLKTANLRLGLLINSNVTVLAAGIRRVVL